MNRAEMFRWAEKMNTLQDSMYEWKADLIKWHNERELFLTVGECDGLFICIDADGMVDMGEFSDAEVGEPTSGICRGKWGSKFRTQGEAIEFVTEKLGCECSAVVKHMIQLADAMART